MIHRTIPAAPPHPIAAPRAASAHDDSARLRLLVDAGAVLAATLDSEDGLQRLAALLVEHVADYAVTYLVDEDHGVRRVGVAHRRRSEDARVRELLTLPPPLIGSPGAGVVIETGMPVLVTDLTDEKLERSVQDTRHLEIVRSLRPRSLIVVPLTARGRTLGAISVATTEAGRRPYDRRDLEFLMELASRAALVVDNARLLEHAQEELDRRRLAETALRRQNEQLRMLTRLGEAIGRARALDEIFEQALNGLLATLDIDRAAILLFDDDGVLRFRAWRGLSDAYRVSVEGHSPWSRDMPHPDPIVIADAATDPRLDEPLRETVRREGIGALAFIPLSFEDGLLGKVVLYADRPRPLADEDRDLALAVARSVAVAIARVEDARRVGASRDAAQQANIVKSQFLAVMSHELRTPLNAILGYVDLLEASVDGRLNDRQVVHVDRIRAGARMLVELIDDVLVYARLEAGREELSLESVELEPLLRSAVSLVEPTCGAKGVELRLAAPTTPVPLRTDAGKLRQIVLNLLSNAAKFTDSGRIELRAETSADVLRIAVADTGVGIPAADAERIFEAFTQSATNGVRPKGGTGLGLAICRQLAAVLGGRVEVESTVGVGSTFTLTLPLAGEPTAAG